MGLNELVLKVPASEARPPAGHQPSASVAGSSSNSNATTKSSLKTKKSAVKTHSRESSGASNVSVKFSVNDETVTTTRNPRSSDEDITMSDRLSQDLEEEIIEEDDGFHPERERSKSCESIPHDRLTPYLRNGDMR